MIPGPALLGFLFLVPGALANMFSDPGILLALLLTTSVYHLLPIVLGFGLAYALLSIRERWRPARVAQSV